MKENPYALAGWLSIAAAVLLPPMAVLGFLLDLGGARGDVLRLAPLAIVYLAMIGCQTLFSIYVFWRLRSFLKERFSFHEVDTIIVWMIVGILVLTAVMVTGKVVIWLGVAKLAVVFFIAALFLFGIPLAVLSIVFAVKLLRVPSEWRGMKKPYCVLVIIGSALYATGILSPIAMLLDAAAGLILGFVLLRPAEELADEELEFV